MSKFLLLFFFISINIYSQNIECTSTEWFPKSLNVKPFVAATIEAKAGTMFFTNQNNLELNIGMTQDLVSFRKCNFTYSFGADFFTFSRLRSTKEFKFPVETVDYLFGLNGTFRTNIKAVEVGMRVRFSHISAHLVDGMYNNAADEWIGNEQNFSPKPFVYSREFLEFMPFAEWKNQRIYAGFTYLYHVNPDVSQKVMYHAGFEKFYTYFELPFVPFAAIDLKVSDFDEKTAITVAGGLKFGDIDSKGLSVLFNYYNGPSIHGLYFYKDEKYFSIGINLDF